MHVYGAIDPIVPPQYSKQLSALFQPSTTDNESNTSNNNNDTNDKDKDKDKNIDNRRPYHCNYEHEGKHFAPVTAPAKKQYSEFVSRFMYHQQQQ